MAVSITNAATYPVSASPYGTGPNLVADPFYSGVFIPTIWSGKLLEKFYDATVVAAIANTDYEGEIKGQGDKVVIRQKPTITITAYEADQTLDIERPSSNVIELLIDLGFYFNTILDDVLEIQADLNLLSLWADDASEQMKIKIDTEVLASLAADISADNQGDTAGVISGNVNLGKTGAPIALTKDNIIDYVVFLGQVLDEQNIPETGRWLVIPAWAAALIKRSDLRDSSLTGDAVSMARNGRLGMIDRFTLYSSNLLPYADESGANAFDIFAGHQHGLTFASQLDKVETLRAESTFGTLMRGLQVYGRKVTDGKSLALLYATNG